MGEIPVPNRDAKRRGHMGIPKGKVTNPSDLSVGYADRLG